MFYFVINYIFCIKYNSFELSSIVMSFCTFSKVDLLFVGDRSWVVSTIAPSFFFFLALWSFTESLLFSSLMYFAYAYIGLVGKFSTCFFCVS